MELLVHIIILLVSAGMVWFFAGSLIGAVGRLSRRYCRTGFFTAFFVLGFLTSVSEASVAVNSGISGYPGVSVGNLVGASFVVLLFIVPLLAIAGRGISFNEAVSRRGLLLLVLAVVALPVLLVMDGNVTKTEGLLSLVAYGTLAYALYRKRTAISSCDVLEERKKGGSRQFWTDTGKIVLGGIGIFAASHFLVGEAVYFAGALSIPPSLVGLILLSLGTNIPEIVIAIRSVLARQADIALGDYLGSAAMNTFIFGGLALFAGTFFLEASEFIMSAALLIVGLLLLAVFARSRATLSRGEGIVLILFYGLFLALQMFNVARFVID